MEMEIDAKKTTIMDLPAEMIEAILSSEKYSLTVREVLNFGETCSKFHDLVNGFQLLWKNQVKLRWPTLMDAFSEGVEYDWRQVYEHCIVVRQSTRKLLGQMSRWFFKTEELSNSDFAEFETLVNSADYSYNFIMDQLFQILNSGSRLDNVTEKYYAEKVITFLRHQYLKKQWNKFIDLPEEKQLSEIGALLIAQWGQPTVTIQHFDISIALDEIAEQVKTLLRSRRDLHPIFSVPVEVTEQWRTTNLRNSYFTPEESKIILKAISKVLFDNIGFYSFDQNTLASCWINKVLENRHGISEVLYVIYESVARRLGVRCDFVCSPSHCFLGWKDDYSETESPHSLIKISISELFYPPNSCPRTGASRESQARLATATKPSVMSKLAYCTFTCHIDDFLNRRRSTLQRNALELNNMINSTDYVYLMKLVQFYLMHSINVNDIRQIIHEFETHPSKPLGITQLAQVKSMLEKYEIKHPKITAPPTIVPKKRKDNVFFPIGLVMKHKRYNYFCVLFGWDYTCEASSEWVSQMGVHKLTHKDKQPFYNVLVDDGSERYVAQENLIMVPDPGYILHSNLGRYFKSCGNRECIPNDEMEMQYPHDTAVRKKMIADFYYN